MMARPAALGPHSGLLDLVNFDIGPLSCLSDLPDNIDQAGHSILQAHAVFAEKQANDFSIAFWPFFQIPPASGGVI
jgi:hypothetical protein